MTSVRLVDAPTEFAERPQSSNSRNTGGVDCGTYARTLERHAGTPLLMSTTAFRINDVA
jgi:hypothetical protein